MKKKIISVTPAYCEEKHIGKVIKQTKKYVDYSIVVDDCSKDNTWIEAIESGADIIIKNPKNKGQGFSLREGIKFALNFNPDAIITVDADLQHDAKHIPSLVKPLFKGYDIVVGTRFKDMKNMPFVKRIGNFGLNMLTRILFGIQCSDSQSGYRAYSPEAAKKLEFFIHRYGWASIMYAEISEKHLHYKEVPIGCIYHDPKKGTTIRDGIWIGLQLINYKRIHLQKRIFK